MTTEIRTNLSAWPKEGLEAITRCPVCESKDRKLLYEGMTDRVFYCAPGEWLLKQCLGCGCAYLDPRPTIETIHLAYQKYYTHKKRHRSQRLLFIRRYARALANGYCNQKYGGNLQPASRLGPVAIRLLPGKSEGLDSAMRYLPKVWSGASVLDVGFGSGDFLLKAHEIGWAVAGADPDPVAVENAKMHGLQVRQGGVEAFADQPEHFDVIAFRHVIEHVHDPKVALVKAFLLLKPGGQIYLEAPNIQALGHDKFGRYWLHLDPPRHLTIFNWPGLEGLLKQAGFENLKRLCRNYNYPNSSAHSRAVSQGADRNKEKILRHDRLMGIIAGLRTRINGYHSEFVALIAYKPR